MRKAITINIPEPCHEDWNKMTPKEQGRHCDACNKTVIDFTKKTDEQIIKTLEANGKLCGRFKTQQLNREIVLARKDKNNYLSWVASSLFAFMALGNLEGHAQGKPKTVKVDSNKVPQVKGKIATSVINEKIISGTITTASDGLPLPGTSVIIKGTDKGVQTDFDGLYKIKVNIGDVLVVSYVGMQSTEITVGTSNIIDIVLEDDSSLDDIIIVGGWVSYSHYEYCRDSEDYETSVFATKTERDKVKKNREHYENWKKRNKARRIKWKKERINKRKAIRNGEQDRASLGKFFYGIKSLFSKK